MVDVVEAVLDWRNTTLILDEKIVEGSWVFDEGARATLIQLIEDSKKKLRDMMLEKLKEDYASELSNGTHNENNDLRILALIEMLERCANLNEGHAKLTII